MAHNSMGPSMPRRFLVALTVAITTASMAPAADTYPRQLGVDALHYVFRLTVLVDASTEIQGNATAIFRLTRDGVREIAMDLASPTTGGRGMTVAEVQRDGTPVAFSHRDDRLVLPVSADARTGREITFRITYKGIPASGLRIIDNIHGERTAFSENWSNRARQWLPMIDHPYDKATGEFIVTTDARYQVVANGALMEQLDQPDGRRRTHWRESVPISSWLYAIGIARFALKHDGDVHGVPLQYWVFPQDAAKGYALFDQDARASFEFFTERVGPYAYEKIAHVQAAGLGGGTEHASNIFYGEKSIASGSGPVVHETAHQWFGNAVTERDWDDVWLSEGFATYFTLLYTEHARGRDAFVDGLRRSRATVLRLEAQSPDTPVVHRNLDEKTQRVLNQFVYQKGGWALHMLRGLVGTDTFWRGIRAYYQEFFNLNASTDDFRQVMERAAGRDLSRFFMEWLNRSGVPKLEGSWRYDAAAKKIVVSLSQTQTVDPFAFPLEIGVVATPGALPRIERVEMSAREATFTIDVAAAPASVTLDPNVWLLADFGAFVAR
jgi:aminopeptidase N